MAVTYAHSLYLRRSFSETDAPILAAAWVSFALLLEGAVFIGVVPLVLYVGLVLISLILLSLLIG